MDFGDSTAVHRKARVTCTRPPASTRDSGSVMCCLCCHQRLHAYVLMLPVDVLVKLSASGATPDVALALKFATGAPKGIVLLASFEKADSVCDAS